MDLEIVGHKVQRSGLLSLLSKGKLPPTMMFAGAPGIGKALVGKALARGILCKTNEEALLTPSSSIKVHSKGCGSCPTCKVLIAGNHPDFHVVSAAEKNESSVEAIRDLLFSLHLSPFSSKARVVLIDHAELLSISVSNTLLKILEEPPANTYFILIVTNPSKLPPTLLSRCQIWFFDSLRDEEVLEILAQRGWAERGDIKELATIADGSLENLDHIEQHIDDWHSISEQLSAIAAGSRATAAVLASDLGRKKDSLATLLKLMRIFARHQMLKVTHEGPSRAEIASRWALFITNLISAEQLLFERHLAATPTLTVILDALAPGAGGPSAQFTHGARLIGEIAV